MAAHIEISTRLSKPVDVVWKAMQSSHCLLFLSAPLLRFVPIEPAVLPRTWSVGGVYRFQLRLFGLLPVGWHELRPVRKDESRHELENNDRTPSARSWKHVLSVHAAGADACIYTDALDIDAGWRTPFLVLFLKYYYRHRHRRWPLYDESHD